MEHIILNADSGATKTEWVATLPDGRELWRGRTQGINPFQMTEAEIVASLRPYAELLDWGQRAGELHFYGAGCRAAGLDRVRLALEALFPDLDVLVVGSDLLGAARALFGEGSGIACILGTGSNSGLYLSGQLAANVAPLGFILGDEGSGAVLGRRLLGDVLKGQLPQELCKQFVADYPEATPETVIERVYRGSRPSAYLAGFAPFLYRHRGEPAVARLLAEEFDRFFQRNVAAYGRSDLPVGFVGSIAYHFREEVAAAAARHGYLLGAVRQAPL